MPLLKWHSRAGDGPGDQRLLPITSLSSPDAHHIIHFIAISHSVPCILFIGGNVLGAANDAPFCHTGRYSKASQHPEMPDTSGVTTAMERFFSLHGQWHKPACGPAAA